MKEERTAGPLHSAHSMQLHSPRHDACSPHLHFFSHSAPVYALLTAPQGFPPRDQLRSLGPVWPRLAHLRTSGPEFSLASPALSPHLSAQCLSSHSPLSATLACFVNNHLFVAGMAAAITSDLPVSSIMDRLLDVNICKSLLLDSPPGRD